MPGFLEGGAGGFCAMCGRKRTISCVSPVTCAALWRVNNFSSQRAHPKMHRCSNEHAPPLLPARARSVSGSLHKPMFLGRVVPDRVRRLLSPTRAHEPDGCGGWLIGSFCGPPEKAERALYVDGFEGYSCDRGGNRLAPVVP